MAPATATEMEMMDSYMLVARCWNNPAVARPMSSGEAISRLVAIRHARSSVLRTRAAVLLDDIINLQAPIPGVDSSVAR